MCVCLWENGPETDEQGIPVTSFDRNLVEVIFNELVHNLLEAVCTSPAAVVDDWPKYYT